MKGQIKIEFVIGVVIFAIIIFYIASQISTAFVSAQTDTRIDSLKSKSIVILDMLTKDSVRGLAIAPDNLNRTKISNWNGDNCAELAQYDLRGYRLVIKDSTGEILFCGFEGITQIRTSIMRFVKIDNSYGNVTMEMW